MYYGSSTVLWNDGSKGNGRASDVLEPEYGGLDASFINPIRRRRFEHTD